MSRSVRAPDYRRDEAAPAARPVSFQACATKLTIAAWTGAPDIIGYCTMPLGHDGAHHIRTTT